MKTLTLKSMKVSAPSRKWYWHTKSQLKGERGNGRDRENERKGERKTETKRMNESDNEKTKKRSEKHWTEEAGIYRK